jgi:hypothetical protein
MCIISWSESVSEKGDMRDRSRYDDDVITVPRTTTCEGLDGIKI